MRALKLGTFSAQATIGASRGNREVKMSGELLMELFHRALIERKGDAEMSGV